MNSQGALAPG